MFKLPPKISTISYSILMLLVLFMAAFAGSYDSRKEEIEKSIIMVKSRIAIDLMDLGIEPDLHQTSKDNGVIRSYMLDLNQYLSDNQFPIQFESIAHSRLNSLEADIQSLTLQSARGAIDIQIFVTAPYVKLQTIFLCIVLWLGFFALIHKKQKYAAHLALRESVITKQNQAKLIIDLRSRSLYLSTETDVKAQLSNKPLCFYLAMLTYCGEHSSPQLYHNKQLPDGFIEAANKYFARLLELGHSKRKRPDFDNNIDKMLSEIRTALDEILKDDTELRSCFFPKKAQGEGSRSKLHNFALTSLEPDRFELIGD